MLEAVEKHGAKTLLVQLTCNRKKLNERVGLDSRRAKGTILDTELLNELLKTYDLFTPYLARPSLQLDTTDTPPRENAATIVTHLQNQKEPYADR